MISATIGATAHPFVVRERIVTRRRRARRDPSLDFGRGEGGRPARLLGMRVLHREVAGPVSRHVVSGARFSRSSPSLATERQRPLPSPRSSLGWRTSRRPRPTACRPAFPSSTASSAGGLVPASLVLVSGDPGIGKSTLLLMALREMSGARTVALVTGEESAAQVKLRADRLGGVGRRRDLGGDEPRSRLRDARARTTAGVRDRLRSRRCTRRSSARLRARLPR